MGLLVEVTSGFWHQFISRSLVNDIQIYEIYKLKNQGQVKYIKVARKIDKNQATRSVNDLELLFNWIHISSHINFRAITYIHSGADKRPLPSNTPPKQAATLKLKRSLQAL